MQGLVQSRMLKDAIEGIPELQERLGLLVDMFDVQAARSDQIKLSRDADYDRALRTKVCVWCR